MKIALFKRLDASPLLDEPRLSQYFDNDFPPTLAKRYALDTIDHPLRRQIIGTSIANLVINQAGITFVPATAAIVQGKHQPLQ